MDMTRGRTILRRVVGWGRRGRAIAKWAMAVITAVVVFLSVADALGWHFHWGTSPLRLEGTYLVVFDGRVLIYREWAYAGSGFSSRGFNEWRHESVQIAAGVPIFFRDNLVIAPATAWVTITPTNVIIRTWLLSVVCLAATLLLWWPARWTLHRHAAGCCQACGYSMKGLERGAKCPECGAGAAV